jgi:hypothetical protein
MREGALKNEQSGGTQWREAPALEESARGNSLFARASPHTLLGSKAKLRKQGEVIRDVMLSAGQCATWLTLDELAKLTHYPPASISAQLRHLRKPRFGAHTVVKRWRTTNKAMRAEGFGAVWEYAVQQERRTPVRRRARLGFTHGAIPVVLPRACAVRECSALLGLSERSSVNWTEEVRHHCGKELLRRGMFPPRKYFSEST